MEIRIYKSKKILHLIADGGGVREFKIGIGKNETGHKKSEGDHRTPEGRYEICVKNPKSKFHLSLGLNYPNRSDAEAGLKNKIISREEFDEICKRIDAKQGSLWGTALGGAIYIHGDLESQSWTEGCIRMLKEDIERIYAEVEIGTSVMIFP